MCVARIERQSRWTGALACARRDEALLDALLEERADVIGGGEDASRAAAVCARRLVVGERLGVPADLLEGHGVERLLGKEVALERHEEHVVPDGRLEERDDLFAAETFHRALEADERAELRAVEVGDLFDRVDVVLRVAAALDAVRRPLVVLDVHVALVPDRGCWCDPRGAGTGLVGRARHHAQQVDVHPQLRLRGRREAV